MTESEPFNRPDSRVLVIAEAGVNHNGSLDLGLSLVEAAHKTGADVVKFQTFKASKLATASAPRSQYQDRNTGDSDSQLEMLQKLELGHGQFRALMEGCERLGIEFMSTPFDEDSARFLVQDLGVRRLKIGSGDLTNGPLLLTAARLGRPILISTGMANLGEVEEALSILAFGYVAGPAEAPTRGALAEAFRSPEGRRSLEEKVLVFHCTTEYPAPFEETNLRAMDTLAAAYGVAVGFSDHTPGIAIPVAAVARGARAIEKHLTTDRTLPGPDHKASLEPAEFTAMVTGVRQVEAALGSPVKAPTPAELPNVAVARKSLVAARDVAAGEVLDETNLGVLRPGGGLSPMQYWSYLGRRAQRAYRKGELIQQ